MITLVTQPRKLFQTRLFETELSSLTFDVSIVDKAFDSHLALTFKGTNACTLMHYALGDNRAYNYLVETAKKYTEIKHWRDAIRDAYFTLNREDFDGEEVGDDRFYDVLNGIVVHSATVNGAHEYLNDLLHRKAIDHQLLFIFMKVVYRCMTQYMIKERETIPTSLTQEFTFQPNSISIPSEIGQLNINDDHFTSLMQQVQALFANPFDVFKLNMTHISSQHFDLMKLIQALQFHSKLEAPPTSIKDYAFMFNAISNEIPERDKTF